jgi:protoheme IX farnesyltransferase
MDKALIAPTAGVSRVRWADAWTLTKPGITGLVLVTTALGYYIASGSLDWTAFLLTLAGTALVSAGSGAMNMAMEHGRDARMERTEDRPVASGRISPGWGWIYGLGLASAGSVLLAAFVHPWAGGLAAASCLIYIGAYTPLKSVTTLNTLVGAVSGAVPPMIGWAAARGDVSTGAWALFAILFFWQMPHFLAIAWMYRDEYDKAGFAMLPVVDAEGVSTARQAILQTMALIVASLIPAWIGLANPVYYFAAAALGIGFLAFSVAFMLRRSRARARGLFLASIAYLPALLAVLALTKI